MTNDRDGEEQRDQTWPEMVRWDLGGASAHGREMLWQCDAVRAGRLYERRVFASREEAEAFVVWMRQREPDQIFNVEAIKASTVWN